MQARDAAGRQVSLLNDENVVDSSDHPLAMLQKPADGAANQAYISAYSRRSPSPCFEPPELFRSDSYDSQISNEPMSPLTPIYDCSRPYASPYDDYVGDYSGAHAVKNGRIMKYNDARSFGSYDDDSSGPPSSLNSSVKRYPCRFRDTRGCEKTFTTSGHASRHSKIHTAEKAVQCTFRGCSKKFTRADNMKQHLETHFKEKSRSGLRQSVSVSDRRASAHSKTLSRAKIPSAVVSLLPSLGRLRDTRGGLDALAAVATQETV